MIAPKGNCDTGRLGIKDAMAMQLSIVGVFLIGMQRDSDRRQRHIRSAGLDSIATPLLGMGEIAGTI